MSMERIKNTIQENTTINKIGDNFYIASSFIIHNETGEKITEQTSGKSLKDVSNRIVKIMLKALKSKIHTCANERIKADRRLAKYNNRKRK